MLLKRTRSLRQFGLRPEFFLSCDDHWTLTGPAHPSGGAYGPCGAIGNTTNAKFKWDKAKGFFILPLTCPMPNAAFQDETVPLQEDRPIDDRPRQMVFFISLSSGAFKNV